MKKRLFVVVALLIAVTSMAVAPVSATAPRCCNTYARGDYQILSNDASGAVVRVWVNNNCWHSRYVLVTVVANATDGSLVQGQYTLYLPCFGSRPVDIQIDTQIANVNKIIATPLGA